MKLKRARYPSQTMLQEYLQECRNAADPLNLKVTHGRLEVRRNFFSERVIEGWNRIPASVKKEEKNTTFRSKYRKLRAPSMQPAAVRADR
jgi:hypothetical protein